jgi:Kef-type K+ transport system membrane component KefB
VERKLILSIVLFVSITVVLVLFVMLSVLYDIPVLSSTWVSLLFMIFVFFTYSIYLMYKAFDLMKRHHHHRY